VDIPSQRLKPGDKIELREHSRATDYFKRLDEVSPTPPAVPGWLFVDRKKLVITITALPTREDAEPDIKEQLIVEYYSR
jgi:small subunit ribosomal protein S4